MKTCPCKDCSERYIDEKSTCHSKCQKYKDWKSELDGINAKRREFQKMETDYIETIRRSKRRR